MHEILGSFRIHQIVPNPAFAHLNGMEVFSCSTDSPFGSEKSIELINKTFEHDGREYSIVDVERYAVPRPTFEVKVYTNRINDGNN